MLPRVIEIEGSGRHLSLERGFMRVAAEGEILGHVPLDDIAAVIANGYGLTYSNNLLLALSKRGAAVVLCGNNHAPQAILWPLDGHHLQAGRMRAQLEAKKPTNKRLWQRIIVAKILNQAAVAEILGHQAAGLRMLVRKVKSGDPSNLEAQAARQYWQMIMGKDFRRDRHASGVNGLLNYGYMVLRAATARAVAGAGLHPSLGLHHRSALNPMCLVDDLMEPFRPVVDLTVVRLKEKGMEDVNKETKTILGGLAAFDMATEKGRTPMTLCLSRLAASLAQIYLNEETELELPLAPEKQQSLFNGESCDDT